LKTIFEKDRLYTVYEKFVPRPMLFLFSPHYGPATISSRSCTKSGISWWSSLGGGIASTIAFFASTLMVPLASAVGEDGDTTSSLAASGVL
jgi:hypothetical protein